MYTIYVEKIMRRTFILTSMILILGLLIHVSESSAHPWTSSEFVVVKLERQYYQNLENQDVELMDSLLHENFVLSSMGNSTFADLDEQTFLASMPKQVITSQNITHIKVNIKGNVAKAVTNISMTKTYDGKDHSGDYEVYATWVREGRGWKLLNRQIKLLQSK